VSDTIKVICRRNGANTNTRSLTDGKVYEARKETGKEYCRTWLITNDLGHDMVILPDEPSAHLCLTRKSDMYPYSEQDVVGLFVTARECDRCGNTPCPGCNPCCGYDGEPRRCPETNACNGCG
jgi:hypothetical protein